MNQKGYSWPEAILTITILSVIFGTLLPVATHMTVTMHKKKVSMHAAETAYKGAIAYQAYRQVEGTRTVGEINYDWRVIGNAICVSYRLDNEEFTNA